MTEKISTKFNHLIEHFEDGSYKSKEFNPADCLIYPEKTAIGKAKDLKVAIFTLTKDRISYTKQMYSAMKKTAGYPFDWFVVEQGSKDGTAEWIKDKVKAAIYYDVNVGIGKGWNDAVELIKKTGDFQILIKLDNDSEMMTQDWLKRMIEIFKRNKGVVLSPYVEGLEENVGGVLRARQGGDPYVLINDELLGIVPYLGGICWASPIEVYNDFKFEEHSFFTGGKDYMISQYARSIGYSCFYMENLRLKHIDSTAGQHKRYPDYFKEREKELTEKYGV